MALFMFLLLGAQIQEGVAYRHRVVIDEIVGCWVLERPELSSGGARPGQFVLPEGFRLVPEAWVRLEGVGHRVRPLPNAMVVLPLGRARVPARNMWWSIRENRIYIAWGPWFAVRVLDLGYEEEPGPDGKQLRALVGTANIYEDISPPTRHEVPVKLIRHSCRTLDRELKQKDQHERLPSN